MKKAHQASLQELNDPSESMGYVQILQKEALFEVGSNEAKSQLKRFEDWIMVRMFVNQEQHVKIQLTSEVDVFFYYAMENDWSTLQQQMSAMGIQIKFQELPSWLGGVLNSKKQEYLLTFAVQDDKKGEWSINQRLHYKTVNILNLPFLKLSQTQFRENLMYRYKRMLAKKEILNEVLSKGNNMIRLKNPSLLLNFQKTRRPDIFK